MTATGGSQQPAGPAGTVYLIHLNERYKHAGHYLGRASNLEARLTHHARGTGANLLRVAREAGIGWQLARTWTGDRSRERQLKKQGGRSRLCPICKDPQRGQTRAQPRTSPCVTEAAADPVGAVFHAELPAELKSARQAREAVRSALAAWGMDELTGDAELLASELVANAAEHADGKTIGFALRGDSGGACGVTCEVSDTSPAHPYLGDALPEAERGRGLSIVAALATASGVRADPGGKTSWFTLALTDRAQRIVRHQPEAEPEAGA
jgi:anti-sigma regulatory factor (Ser/Thr protein kinase)/predicted GIY-YIG superfamily endonuclease